MALRDSASLLVGLVVVLHTCGAWAEVVVNTEDKVEVYLGDTVGISCTFTSDDGIGGLIMQWLYVTRSGEKQRIYFKDATMNVVEPGTPFTDRISVNGTSADLVLTISNVQLEDELEFICRIQSLTDGTQEGRTKLKVFEIPKLPTVEGVEAGISVNEEHPSKIGSCEVKNGYPKPNVTWYRDNAPLRSIPDEVNVVSSITTESSGLYSVRSELRKKVVKEDKDAKFYCEVTYFVPGATKMTETMRINVTVHYPSTAVNIWVESPKGKIKEGDSIELHCSGNGNPLSSIFSIAHADDEDSSDSNLLVLNNVTRRNSGVYTCSSTDTETFEEISGNTTVFVNYLDPAAVIPEDTLVMAQGEEQKVTCNALSSLQTDTAWFKNAEEVAQGHTLVLRNATFDTAGTYVCVVTVPEIEGMETSGTLRVRVQGPPQIMEQKVTEIETYEKTVDLSCNVRGFPVPSVMWTTSDGKDIKTTSQTDTEEGVESVASVTVTADTTAFCKASNDLGTDEVTFNIKAITHITTPATTTSISHATVKPPTANPPKKIKKEGNGVIIAVLIICILLLAILGSVLYFLYKKGKICGRSGKQDLTKEKTSKDNIVVEMKSDNTEEAILLGVNGEKLPPGDQ